MPRRRHTRLKKLPLVLAALAFLGLATVALAVTNTYRVTASTTPKKAGTVKKPVPTSLTFSYSVGELNNQRPSPVKQYKIKIAGLRVNTKAVKQTCIAYKINALGTDNACPKAAIVGTGSVDNRVGPSSNPDNQDLHCYLDLTLYNAGKNHVTLYLKGRTANAPPKDCIINTDVAIDASYVRSGTSTTLSFTVPQTLLHPVPGLDNAVRNVTAKIKKITTGKGKKRLAYFSSVGGCKNNKRAVTVTFVPESGAAQKAQGFAKCKK
jgi:hypothetical protein